MNLFEIYESLEELDDKEVIAVITKSANILGERDFAKKKEVAGRAEMPVITPIKSANQQRYELIQRAREFVEEHTRKEPAGRYFYKPYIDLEGINGSKKCVIDEFIVSAEKRTVVCLLRGADTGRVLFRGIAKCMPGDVFNEWIGKAIALAKALQIEFPAEFLKAVQPDEKVVGMIVYDEETRILNKIKTIVPNGEWATNGECSISSASSQRSTIIDDSNAQYGTPS